MIVSQLLFIGTTELMLIAGIALLLFGGKKLPEMMKGLGQGMQSFRKGMNEPIVEEEDEEMPTPTSSPSSNENVNAK
jgi:sec-independent protein translocase protein TatA